MYFSVCNSPWAVWPTTFQPPLWHAKVWKVPFCCNQPFVILAPVACLHLPNFQNYQDILSTQSILQHQQQWYKALRVSISLVSQLPADPNNPTWLAYPPSEPLKPQLTELITDHWIIQHFRSSSSQHLLANRSWYLAKFSFVQLLNTMTIAMCPFGIPRVCLTYDYLHTSTKRTCLLQSYSMTSMLAKHYKPIHM